VFGNTQKACRIRIASPCVREPLVSVVCFRESDKASLDKIFFKRFQKYFCQILL